MTLEMLVKKHKILREQKPNINCSKFKQFPPLLLEDLVNLLVGENSPFELLLQHFNPVPLQSELKSPPGFKDDGAHVRCGVLLHCLVKTR